MKAQGSLGFVGNTSTSRSPFSLDDFAVGYCVDPARRAFSVAISLVRGRTNPVANFEFTESSRDTETGTAALVDFALALGLEDELRVARAEIGAAVQAQAGHETLKSLRLSAGLSQKELADRLETTQPRISVIESGKEGVSLSFAMRIARVLGVDLERIAKASEHALDG